MKSVGVMAISLALMIPMSGLAAELQLPDDYGSLSCLPAYDGDDCLPTGYARALASKSRRRSRIWELELLIDSMDDKAAEPKLRDFMSRYPKRFEPRWMMAKNYYFRAEQLPAEDIDGREAALEKGIEWAEKCIEYETTRCELQRLLWSITCSAFDHSRDCSVCL